MYKLLFLLRPLAPSWNGHLAIWAIRPCVYHVKNDRSCSNANIFNSYVNKLLSFIDSEAVSSTYDIFLAASFNDRLHLVWAGFLGNRLKIRLCWNRTTSGTPKYNVSTYLNNIFIDLRSAWTATVMFTWTIAALFFVLVWLADRKGKAKGKTDYLVIKMSNWYKVFDVSLKESKDVRA